MPSRGSWTACALLAAFALATAVAPAAPPSAHYAFTLHGLVATPLWWGATPFEPTADVSAFDVGPLPAGVSVRAHAKLDSPGLGVHLYVLREDALGSVPFPFVLEDPLPGGAKTLTLAGPGAFTVLVDADTSIAYSLDVTFDGHYGDPASGPAAAFPLTARGSYVCPLAPVSACPA